MKKKSTKKSFFQKILDFIVGSGKGSILDAVQEKVTETIDEAEIRLERAIKKVLSMVGAFLLIFIGLIFALVGISKYLSESVDSLSNGLGFIVVGAAIIIIALILRIFSNNY